MGRIPDRWNDYDRTGKPILGTRFICFKVPLSKAINENQQIDEDKMLYPDILPTIIPNLGLVIDLTYTTKYYHPKDILKHGIEHRKILVMGHNIPSKRNYKEFKSTVNSFLQANSNNDKLIGVHCTHGLNRSGYLVCRYMVDVLRIPALEAFASFEVARGHKMERKNYLDHIISIDRTKSTISINTNVDKGTQSESGYWINKKTIRQSKKQQPSNDTSSSDDNEPPNKSESDNTQFRVHLRGCVNVDNSDLIPDDQGGYFVHIKKSDIHPLPSSAGRNWRDLGPPTPTNTGYDGRVGAHGGSQFVTPIVAYKNYQQSPLGSCYDDYRPAHSSRFNSERRHGPADRFNYRQQREEPSRGTSPYQRLPHNHASLNSGNGKRSRFNKTH